MSCNPPGGHHPGCECWEQAHGEQLKAAVQTEREACAKVCEELRRPPHGFDRGDFAYAIRARLAPSKGETLYEQARRLVEAPANTPFAEPPSTLRVAEALRLAETALEHCRNRPHMHNPPPGFHITQCEVIDRALAILRQVVR